MLVALVATTSLTTACGGGGQAAQHPTGAVTPLPGPAPYSDSAPAGTFSATLGWAQIRYGT